MVSVLRVLFAALMTVSASAIASAQQSGAEVPATAQTEVEQPVAAPLVRQILVEGNQRVEADTVLSYLLLQPGQPFDSRLVNLSIQTLMATGLFSDVQFEDRGQIVLVRVQENPIINRVILEGIARSMTRRSPTRSRPSRVPSSRARGSSPMSSASSRSIVVPGALRRPSRRRSSSNRKTVSI